MLMVVATFRIADGVPSRLIIDYVAGNIILNEQRRDLLEILEDRYERRSTIVTSQFAVEHWHELINDPTLADAILDRLVHHAYRLALTGDSMRKLKRPKEIENT